MIQEALDLSHGTANDDGYPGAVPGAMHASPSCAHAARPRDCPRGRLCNSAEAVRGEEGGGADWPAEVSPGTETLIRWVEAPKSKGLALVCISPRDKIAVIVVRGTENARNVVQALKVWPVWPRYPPEVCVCVSACVSHVAARSWGRRGQSALFWLLASHPSSFLSCLSGQGLVASTESFLPCVHMHTRTQAQTARAA